MIRAAERKDLEGTERLEKPCKGCYNFTQNKNCGVIRVKIAICDDETVCRARLLDIAEDYSEERKDKQIEYTVFSEPAELLQAVWEGADFDIFILDIVMPDLNGIQLGQAIREQGVESKIIYLTSSEEYALDSFRVRAFDYILKPIARDVFYKVMDEAINSIHIKKDKGVIIKTKEGNARLSFDSILYIELSNRSLIYHLADGKAVESTTLRTSFSDAVAELLADGRFAQCGVSTVVNLHHITSVENEGAVFKGNERVFLNKKLCRDLRGAWNNYWISKEG